MQMPAALPRRLSKLSRMSRLPAPNQWIWLADLALLAVLGVIGYMRRSQPVAAQTVATPESVLLAFTVSAVVGIFFGFYPASQAARLHPIQALRYE